MGILGRDPQSIHDLATLTHNLHDEQKFPSVILYPVDFFPHRNLNQQAMVEAFIKVLEDFLGVKTTRFSLVERWNQRPPMEAQGRSIKDYLAKVFESLAYSATCANLTRAHSGQCATVTATSMMTFDGTTRKNLVKSRTLGPSLGLDGVSIVLYL